MHTGSALLVNVPDWPGNETSMKIIKLMREGWKEGDSQTSRDGLMCGDASCGQ